MDGGLGAFGCHRATVVILVMVAILVGREASNVRVRCSGAGAEGRDSGSGLEVWGLGFIGLEVAELSLVFEGLPIKQTDTEPS